MTEVSQDLTTMLSQNVTENSDPICISFIGGKDHIQEVVLRNLKFKDLIAEREECSEVEALVGSDNNYSNLHGGEIGPDNFKDESNEKRARLE